ncbi:PCI domain-containing protein [Gorgonomyces haynaldii]|nr:PCI domain-containing protein [Gorgonomyces haynaldii]
MTSQSQTKKAVGQEKPKNEDVEMDTAPQAKTEAELKKEERDKAQQEIKGYTALIERAVTTLESRYATRAIRASALVRPKLDLEILEATIVQYVQESSPVKKLLVKALGIAPKPSTGSAVPEVSFFVALLAILYLVDKKKTETVLELSSQLIKELQALNRRTLDQIGARIYFYLTHAYEQAGRVSEIHQFLIASYRTSVLRQDLDIQAVLLNALLRYYLHHNLIDQADKLVAKASFPESAGNSQLARYLLYLGRIKAIQLEYSEAHENVQQAIRKAPTTSPAAGFQQVAHKLSIIVQLLMGEIPERSVFRQPMLRKSLAPYLQITRAVREGDLSKFQEILAQFAQQFKDDKNYTLILRLRHNVIKAGVRKISLSYSKISLRDICIKLQLDSEEDAEFIVAKAVRDGVIDAVVDHEKGTVLSKENVDLYATNEPQQAFNYRISFCLNLHNESVKAMRFPQDVHKKELEEVNELLEEERAAANEIAESSDKDDE